MLPENLLSTDAIKGDLINPWSRSAMVSTHYGPVALNDPSLGLLYKVWRARCHRGEGNIYLSSIGVPEFVWYTHSKSIMQISLSFDQNGRPVAAFVDADGYSFLRWYDSAALGEVTTALPYATTPRVTLDDARQINISGSDVVLAYVNSGVIKYRRQRDRFTIEYTPLIGEGGAPASAIGLRHISMNSALRLQFITDGSSDDDWTVPEVISDLCNRAGLDDPKLGLSEMDWQRIIRGFTVGNSYSASGSLQALSSVFFFDPSTANGLIKFNPRGGDSKMKITSDDLIEDGDSVEVVQVRRFDAINVPRVLHLNYHDLKGGLNTDKQRSERPEGTRSEGEQSLQTPIILTADEAATLVSQTHGMMAEQQKGELEFAVPDSFMQLTEGDPVLVQEGGKMVRGIIQKATLDEGQIQFRVVRDRQSIYTSKVEGIPAAPVTRPPSSIAGPTLLDFIDCHIIRDSHDQLGFYLTASGVMPAWPGANIDLSLDGGETWIESQSTRIGGVIGELATPLGDHPQEYPDFINSCEVNILSPDEMLSGTSLPGMLNRINLAIIGDELINFSEVDEVSPNRWELKTLLRGRKGTNPVAHAAGERFLLMSGAVFIPAELSWINRPLTFRAATFGRPLDEATVMTVTFTGQTQVERQPAYLQASRLAGNIRINWQGVGRLGSGTHVAMGAYFNGYRVTCTHGSLTRVDDVINPSHSFLANQYPYPTTVRVQQRNQITGLGPYIEVVI